MSNLSNKSRRFMRKMMTGFDCRSGEIARVFVLSESDEAIDAGLNFRVQFKDLMRMLRKKHGAFEYCAVIHRQGVASKKLKGQVPSKYDEIRKNVHVVYFGNFIDKQVIEDFWFKNFLSHRSQFEKLKFEEKTAYYLCKYVGGDEKFVRAQFSKNWVFPCWWAFSAWCNKVLGEYPKLSVLKKYNKMSKEELKNDVYYSRFKLETKKLKKESTEEWLARIALQESSKNIEKFFNKEKE